MYTTALKKVLKSIIDQERRDVFLGCLNLLMFVLIKPGKPVCCGRFGLLEHGCSVLCRSLPRVPQLRWIISSQESFSPDFMLREPSVLLFLNAFN
jgi:hypothetical protein